MILVAVHQPNFLPWLGWWNKFTMADVFVVYAGVQFEKGGYQNRVQMDGRWLTVPVSGGLAPIKDIRVADHAALRKMAKGIRQRFARAPYRGRLDGVIEVLDGWSGTHLLDLNLKLLSVTIDALRPFAVPRVVIDDEVRDCPPGEALSAVVRSVGGDAYLSGESGPAYMARGDIDLETVLVQRPNPGLPPGTVLPVLAQDDAPARVVEVAAAWEVWS